MGKKIAIVLGGIVAVIAILAVVIVLQPAEFRIERSTVVGAPPAQIYPLLQDFHAWAEWSPWEKLDPSMSKTFAGAPKGKGASYTWSGNDKAGAGTMEITDAVENTNVTVKLAFLKPFPATNTAQFTIAEVPSGSAVTWTMTGRNGFAGKAFGLFVNVDKLVGADFEKGLAGIKTIAEQNGATRKRNP